MIKKYFFFCILTLLPLLVACHEDEDDIFATAVITLVDR